jgi:hypothetical protein
MYNRIKTIVYSRINSACSNTIENRGTEITDRLQQIINKIQDFIMLDEIDNSYIETLDKSYLLFLLKFYNTNVKNMNEYIEMCGNRQN